MLNRHHRMLSASLALALASLAACGGDDPAQAGGTTTAGSAEAGAVVTVETFDFQPDPVTVPAGTAITFVNGDAIDHTVTAGTRDAPRPEVFDGALPDEGAEFLLTLDERGTYEYFCAIHEGPGMTATITVT